ncbi:hypothetical protein B0H14DRAFT_2656079 [Mycena olivaceomarginata]|nr:hypothetical protein B0H14DRAFT_2656079 [Mycena olivaceomarginata]
MCRKGLRSNSKNQKKWRREFKRKEDVPQKRKEQQRASDQPMSRPVRKWAKPATETHTHTATFSLAEITGNNIAAPITTFVERASTDNRRRYREEVPVEPASPIKRQRAGLAQPAP